ncbi:methyltransferase domain-containing protein [Streptomyces sp. SID2999]|uniref:class I SAM-dependent methyltransferase n=1 Tax=Streptomyces sp. SID2999 TaxID=2690258 RepID=UPI001368D93D|nr:class I SAM-dependent methyltransferase [Streptomyces sp. SID2999]MYZ10300.1 methyltransferase domain-containing protein [Streptomyces sp. SID2999]
MSDATYDGPGSHDLVTWDRIAERYIELADNRSTSSFHHLADFFQERLKPLSGKSVLDIGCGHGWLTHSLAVQGAESSGIDGSESMISQARRRYPDLTFHTADLTGGLGPALTDAGYDAMVARFSLQCISDIDPLLRDTAVALRPGGLFLVSMPHPAFYMRERVEDPVTKERYRKVTGYLELETRVLPDFGGHRYFHRPVSWYVNSFARHGLYLDDMREPHQHPDTAGSRTRDEWNEFEKWWSTIPVFLGLGFRKAAAG